MSNIEDKILDGPRVHYCDADDDDIREEDSSISKHKITDLFCKPTDEDTRSRCPRDSGTNIHSSRNTGPKGVLEDNKKIDLEAEFEQLMEDDSIIQEMIAKRLSEIPEFGSLYYLRSGDEFLEAIDRERHDVLVVVHIYGTKSSICRNLNLCLEAIAEKFKHIKFISLNVEVTNLSKDFKEIGIPALQAYKAGKLLKSMIQLENNLDKDFDINQVSDLLKENGFI